VNKRLSRAPLGKRIAKPESPYLPASSSRRRSSSTSRLSPYMKEHSLPCGSPGSFTVKIDAERGRGSSRTEEITKPSSDVIPDTKPGKTTVEPSTAAKNATTGMDSLFSLCNKRRASSSEIMFVLMQRSDGFAGCNLAVLESTTALSSVQRRPTPDRLKQLFNYYNRRYWRGRPRVRR
jgi:hypothetical protein